MSKHHELNLHNLPSDVIRMIIKTDRGPLEYTRWISPRWSDLVLEYLSYKKNRIWLPAILSLYWRIGLLVESSLTIRVEDRYRAYFGLESRKCSPISNNADSEVSNLSNSSVTVAPNYELQIVEVTTESVDSVLSVIIPKCIEAASVVTLGSEESIFFDILTLLYHKNNYKIDLLSPNITERIYRLLRRASRMEILQIDMYNSRFDILENILSDISVEELFIMGYTYFDLQTGFAVLDILRAHPLKSLVIGTSICSTAAYDHVLPEVARLVDVCILDPFWDRLPYCEDEVKWINGRPKAAITFSLQHLPNRRAYVHVLLKP